MTGEIDRTIVQPAAEAGRDRGLRWLLLVGVALLLVPMTFLAVQYFAQHGEITELQQTSDSRAVDVGKLAQQVKSLGATPVVQPPPAVPATVDSADLRQAARQAVDDYCAPRNQCRGADGATPNFDAIVTAVVNTIPRPTNGTNGERGPGPTDEQVSSAVADYCDAHNQCAGASGAKGDTGDTGQTGAAGPPGPPGPTCPDGYELRDAVITAPDGTTYQGKACVDPSSSAPPSSDPPIIPGG